MSLLETIKIHPDRLSENICFLDEFFASKEMTWTFVIKGFERVSTDDFECLENVPCTSVASAIREVLLSYRNHHPRAETWWLNYDGAPCPYDWVDVNLTHAPSTNRDCLMIELDELREGCIQERVIQLVNQGTCRHVGAYLDCTSLPAERFLLRWKSLGLNADITRSLGTSVSFSMVDQMRAVGVNHYRIGELAITGRDLLTQDPIPGMRQDSVTPVESHTFLFQ